MSQKNIKDLSNRDVLKKLIEAMKDSKLQLIFAIIGTIAQVALTIILPVITGRIINVVIGPGQVDFSSLSHYLKQMAVVIVLNTIVQWINPLLFQEVAYETVGKLRQQVLEKIHQLPLSYLDRRSTGDLVSRLTTDSELLSDGIVMVFNQFFSGVLTIIVTIVTMARLDFTMMAIVVLLTPLSLLVARYIAQNSYSLYQEQTTSRGKHADIVEETIQQAQLIDLFNGQSDKASEFNKINEEYMDNTQKATFISSTVNPTTRFINALIYASLTLFGALRIMRGSFTVGELTTFLSYANQYTKPFNDISSVLAELQGSLASARRLFSIIEQNSEEETGYRHYDKEEVDGKVNFNRVSFSYEANQDLIKDLTLSIKPGQTVAIVGPTGAGKSTLINLLMRFYDVDKGQVLVDNEPITDYLREEVRGLYGMVLQETWLKTGSIHDNISYSKPGASRDEVEWAAKQAHAHEFIKRLPSGYDTIISDSGDQLSQGERQLLSIARIFMTEPNMLILDEATSSIDTRTEILIQEAFSNLMEGRTSFIIAHRLSTIQNSDLILVMRDGQIVEQGTHNELMKAKGFYYTMQEAHKVG